MVTFTLVLGLGVAACGSSSPDSTATGGSLKGQKATFVTFGGQEEKFFKAAFAEPVANETGMNLSFDQPTEYPKLQVQVKTGNVSWTVVMADPWWSLIYCGKELEELPKGVDTSNIAPVYQVDNCGVAGDTFVFQLMYNANDFPNNPPTSWADFFNTTKYPGKRGVWGSYVVNGAMEAATLAEGAEPDELYPMDISKAIDKLNTIKSDITFYDTLSQSEQLMASEEVSMVIAGDEVSGWNVNTNNKNVDWKPVWNQAIESWDFYIEPKGGNTAAAEALWNRIGSPEGQRQLVESIPSGWTVKKMTPPPKQNAKLREWTPSYHRSETIPLDQHWWAQHYEEAESAWQEWVSG
jgi:putative spermidine/putrescine transport system substrate-binding protein